MSGTKKIDDGGSAFPIEGGVDSGLHADPGMRLRDWFASQALVGFGTWMPVYSDGLFANPETMAHRARLAYQQADAMIAARNSDR